MTGFIIALLAASAGYWVFRLLRFPVPAILGSLFFSAALNLAGYPPRFPLQYLSWFSNVVIGTYVGQRVTRSSVRILRELPVPAIIISAGMVAISLAGGGLLVIMSDLPPATAFIGSTTGGIAEMTLLAIALEADVASVSILQIFRLLAAIMATPFFCRKWTAWRSDRYGEAALPCKAEAAPSEPKTVPTQKFCENPGNYIFLAAAALAGAFTGYALRLPVGILTGAMAAVAALNLTRGEQPPMPMKLRTVAQVGIGIIMAANITPDTLSTFLPLVLPIAGITAAMLSASFLLGCLLHKMTGWNYPTCLLSTSLGGLSQMAIISEEMGGDPLKVSILQTVRLITILVVFPLLLTVLFS